MVAQKFMDKVEFESLLRSFHFHQWYRPDTQPQRGNSGSHLISCGGCNLALGPRAYPAVVSEPLGSLRRHLRTGPWCEDQQYLAYPEPNFLQKYFFGSSFRECSQSAWPVLWQTQLENAFCCLRYCLRIPRSLILILQLLGYTDLRSFPINCHPTTL